MLEGDNVKRCSEPICKEDISVDLVRKLVHSQFPKFVGLPIIKVIPGGWDNVTFRLGDNLLIRLPSATRYSAQVAKEQKWLPILAKSISFEIPRPTAMGKSTEEFPWNWSIYNWIVGEVASNESDLDQIKLADDMVRFLAQLHSIDPTEGPEPGDHNFHRGGSLEFYKSESFSLIDRLQGIIDTKAIGGVIQQALSTTWSRPPVWVHGDLSATNLLVTEGRLKAVLDFGSSAVGDPACDFAIAWTLFGSEAREHIRSGLGIDEATWNRAKSWVLWKSMLTLWNNIRSDQEQVAAARSTIAEVLS